MVRISPILSKKLNIPINSNYNSDAPDYDKIYNDLQREAKKVEIAAPKARLVEENIPQKFVSSIKDNAKDVYNLHRAITKADISDNSLGRLNDLGLKMGAMVIATLLAINSRTKTESIMRFIGGGTFIASMSLWPKLFTALPAKIVHGVDIDKKYISAQGDKKDFYLDNKFIPWDITDITDEKERRRNQKIALQNRTLSMATAGAAVPLMTALICNRIEPLVEKAVVALDVRKVRKELDDVNAFKKHIIKHAPVIDNEKQMDKLFQEYANKNLDEDFCYKLGQMFNILQHPETCKDVDKLEMTRRFHPATDIQKILLRDVVNEDIKIVFDSNDENVIKNLKESLEGAIVSVENSAESLFSVDKMEYRLGEVDANNIIENLKKYAEENGGKISKNKLIQLLSDEKASIIMINGESYALAQNQAKSVAEKIVWNNNDFFLNMKKYNLDFVSVLKGRLRGYRDIADPVVSQSAESLLARLSKRYQKSFFREIKLTKEETDIIANDILGYRAADVMHKHNYNLVKDIEFGSDKYNKLIKKFTKVSLDEIDEYLTALKNRDVLSIFDLKSSDAIKFGTLDKAVKGDTANITNHIINFIEDRRADFLAASTRQALALNFETRLKQGLIKVDGQDIRKNRVLMKSASNIVYQGNISTMYNSAFMADESRFVKLVNAIYEPEAMRYESPQVKEQAKAILDRLLSSNKPRPNLEYNQNISFVEYLKNNIKNSNNDLSWMKKFGTLAFVIAAVTLLIQPLFGNISKEFPKEEEKGGAK